MIKKSYGIIIWPAAVLFQNFLPRKATCSCRVGLSDFCCILALLLFLKHCTDTTEKVLELTYTEQLQKWHRKSKKGSRTMMPFSIKMKRLATKWLIYVQTLRIHISSEMLHILF